MISTGSYINKIVLKSLDKKIVLLSNLFSILLFIIYFPFFLFRKIWGNNNYIEQHTPIKKILLVDLRRIGDIVMLTPLLVELKNIYPNAFITLLSGSWAEQILLNNPNLVDSYCIYNPPWIMKTKHSYYDLIKKISFLKNQKIDLAIDVRGDLKNILIMSLAGISKRVGYSFSAGNWLLTHKIADTGNLKHIVSHHHKIALFLGSNIKLINFKPVLWLSNSENNYKDNSKPFIAVHLGASTSVRILSIKKSSELILSLLNLSDKNILLFYSKEIEDLINNILLIPEVVRSHRVKIFRGDLRKFIVEVASSSLYVGMDSSGAHIAAAFNVPSIVIFGPALPNTCKPIGDNVYIISSDEYLKCRPCKQKICSNKMHQKCYNSLHFDKIFYEKSHIPIIKQITG